VSPSVEQMIEDILRREGGDKFTDLPADRGGPTRYGVTMAALADFRRQPVTRQDIVDLTEGEARACLYELFVARPGFLEILDADLRALCVDAAVNHGARHAVKWLQWAADVAQDGRFGPKSAAAVERADPLELFVWMCSFRLRLYGRLVRLDRSQAQFIGGWINRACEFLEHAARRLEREHLAPAA
jgi:lysozyme family protein